MDAIDGATESKREFPRLLALAIWIIAIGATVAGLRYGLPPKEGPVTATIWWFPFAFMLYLVIPGRELGGLLLVLLQFPLIATLMTLGLRKWSVKRVIVLAIAIYFAAVAVCALVVKLTGMGTR